MGIERTKNLCILYFRIRSYIQNNSIRIFSLYFFYFPFFVFDVYHNSNSIKVYNIFLRYKCLYHYFCLKIGLFFYI